MRNLQIIGNVPQVRRESNIGEYAEEDLGRCMIGDVVPGVRGLQVLGKDTFDFNGMKLYVKRLGTNANFHWASDMTTQIIDGVDYMERK